MPPTVCFHAITTCLILIQCYTWLFFRRASAWAGLLHAFITFMLAKCEEKGDQNRMMKTRWRQSLFLPGIVGKEIHIRRCRSWELCHNSGPNSTQIIVKSWSLFPQRSCCSYTAAIPAFRTTAPSHSCLTTVCSTITWGPALGNRYELQSSDSKRRMALFCILKPNQFLTVWDKVDLQRAVLA